MEARLKEIQIGFRVLCTYKNQKLLVLHKLDILTDVLNYMPNLAFTYLITSLLMAYSGYMAPEYAKNGNFSTKSDVYSFGVLVLEIITGRKNSSFRSLTNLQSHVRN